MEDLSIKAIVIGVSLFITIVTLSAIILYFNSAKKVANVVGSMPDITEEFNLLMNSENFKGYLTGVQVRSLINKFIASNNIKINIIEVSGEPKSLYNINNTWIDSKTGLISEYNLNLINPVWTNYVEKVQNSTETIFDIKLDVDKEV